MVDLLGLTGQERVLDIGTASGYIAALLARCSERVYSVEYNPTLANRARDRLRRLGL